MIITDFIVCDDIRHELNHKISLMGIYEDTIVFLRDPKGPALWPKVMSFSIFLRCLIEKSDVDSGASALEVVFQYAEKSLVIASIDLKKEHLVVGNRLGFVPRFQNYSFESPGSIQVNLNIFDKNKTNIGTISPLVPVKVVEGVPSSSI
ncbi:MAG: hypothetical protein KJ630_24945 [Proteobacteria bacterium]|nr:hypothetical protein [Pseudomonadota bacterium]